MELKIYNFIKRFNLLGTCFRIKMKESFGYLARSPVSDIKAEFYRLNSFKTSRGCPVNT